MYTVVTCKENDDAESLISVAASDPYELPANSRSSDEQPNKKARIQKSDVTDSASASALWA